MAMDDWMANLGGADDQWVAEVWPAKSRTFAIGFRHNLGGWKPEEELVDLAAQFQELEVKVLAARETWDQTIDEFEGKYRDPRDMFPTSKFEPYWRQRTEQCDPGIKLVEALCAEANCVGNRMRAIPAQSIQGIAAKAATLRFDTGLYPDDPAAP
ncbi:hypothetical protein [Mesorhizobium sp. LSHC422A00]|uniref:hypothetical protein n=1 Tax=Mesorhizobium sp. LSHC422A00 TaxID=1287294 RepID=UPI0012EC9BAE|nr:hypothetical protein [Mesorhizobium sp. LSHC422A00]